MFRFFLSLKMLLILFFYLLLTFLIPENLYENIMIESVESQKISNCHDLKTPIVFQTYLGYMGSNGYCFGEAITGENTYLTSGNYSLKLTGDRIYISKNGIYLNSISSKDKNPVLIGSRLFLLGKELDSIKEISITTFKESETIGFKSLITSIYANDEFLFLGFLDGTVLVLNSNYEIVFSFNAKSPILSILFDNNTLYFVYNNENKNSNDGDTKALMSYNYKDKEFVFNEKVLFASNANRQLDMFAIDSYIWIEDYNSFNIYNTKKKEMKKVSLSKNKNLMLYDYISSPKDGIMYFIYKDKSDQFVLSLLLEDGSLLVEELFKADYLRLYREGEDIKIIIEDKLYSLGIKK